MTIEEMKDYLAAVLRALNTVQVVGYQNVVNQAAAMSMVNDILKADIQLEQTKSAKK